MNHTRIVLVLFALLFVTGCVSSETSFDGEPLTLMEQYVALNNGTEPAYANAYWNNEEPGIYVDVISGEALFSSTHKYDSETGWPSFYRALNDSKVEEYIDTSLAQQRTGLKGAESRAHLGHVFDDGPEPTGKRYCMNSAALRFIHKDDLEENGYEGYLYLFE